MQTDFFLLNQFFRQNTTSSHTANLCCKLTLLHRGKGGERKNKPAAVRVTVSIGRWFIGAINSQPFQQTGANMGKRDRYVAVAAVIRTRGFRSM